MTYKYKLARRLAISRNLAMITALVLLAACAGETTAPEAPTTPNTPVLPAGASGFRVLPGTVTIEINQRIRFRGEVQTPRGAVHAPQLSWEASGGTISNDGMFSAQRPGTYRVVGRGHHGRGHGSRQRPDTSIVVVVPRQPSLVGIRVTPRAPWVAPGDTRTFKAKGRLPNGTATDIGVTWTATGGTIDASGVFKAGPRAGRFHVIASNTRGTLSDTVKVRVYVPAVPDTLPGETPDTLPGETPDTTPAPDPTPDPDPTPEPQPEPTVARVVLKPATVTLATTATHRFAAFGRTGAGDSVAVDVTFRATGGTITPTGLYTAGATPGTFRVIAASSELADTALVTLARTAGGGTPDPIPGPGPIPPRGMRGIPFGPYGAWTGSANLKTNMAAFTGSIGSVSAGALVSRINEARRKGVTLLTAMTGGHDPYLTNGVFDMGKWKATMDGYNTPTIRQAVADAVADGVLIGNSVMDEPYVSGMGDGNTWGPKGTMTKARVDEMCRYVKNIFPTLPVGVVHEHDMFEPSNSYRDCQFIVSQYSHRFGDVRKFRDDALALGRRDGIAIAFSMNIMNGGVQAARDGRWACDPARTGGRGTYEPNCRMTAEQVREWGIVLGEAGCALMMWRYDDSFMAKPDNNQAFADIANRLATHPRRPCTGR
jgi:hypothetical protein